MLEHFSQFAVQIARLQKGVSQQSVFDQFCSVTWQPNIDVFETDQELVIYVDLPDIDQTSIRVSVDDEVLRISGSRPKRIPDRTMHVRHMEIPHGEFARLIPLPPGVNAAGVVAEYKECYLIIVVSKAQSND